MSERNCSGMCDVRVCECVWLCKCMCVLEVRLAQGWVQKLTYAHAHTHTHTHIRTHARTHTHALTCTDLRTRERTQTQTHSPTDTHKGIAEHICASPLRAACPTWPTWSCGSWMTRGYTRRTTASRWVGHPASATHVNLPACLPVCIALPVFMLLLVCKPLCRKLLLCMIQCVLLPGVCLTCYQGCVPVTKGDGYQG